METEPVMETNCSLLYDLIEEYENNTFTNCSMGAFRNAEKLGDATNIMFQFMYGVTFLVGLGGNSLVIYVIWKYSKMQTVTNFYILNLAISDGVFLLGVPMVMVTSTYHRWLFGDLFCKLYLSTTSLNQFTSTLFLTVMSFDRYLAVCQPISAPDYRTIKISRIVSYSAWLLSGVMTAPVVMYAHTLRVDDEVNCNVFFPSYGLLPGYIVFTMYSFMLSFAIPFTCIFLFYSLVIFKLRGIRKRSKSKKKSHRKVTKLVFTVILVYLSSWLPYWVLQISLIIGQPVLGHSSDKILLYMSFSLLTYMNSAANPILYAFLSENFKQSFLKAFSWAIGRRGSISLQPDNSMMARRQRTGTMVKSNLCRQDTITNDSGGRNNHLTVSGDISSNVTMSSRLTSSNQQSHTCDEQTPPRNGHLLEVPQHVVHVHEY